MILSPEMQSKISIWRQKAMEGTLTKEEMQEAVIALRGERRSAAAASSSAKRTKAKAAIPSAQSLLDELGEI